MAAWHRSAGRGLARPARAPSRPRDLSPPAPEPGSGVCRAGMQHRLSGSRARGRAGRGRPHSDVSQRRVRGRPAASHLSRRRKHLGFLIPSRSVDQLLGAGRGGDMPPATSPAISRLCHAAPDRPEDTGAAHEPQKPKVGSPGARALCVSCPFYDSGPWGDLSEGRRDRPGPSSPVRSARSPPTSRPFLPLRSVGGTPKTSTGFSPATHPSSHLPTTKSSGTLTSQNLKDFPSLTLSF